MTVLHAYARRPVRQTGFLLYKITVQYNIALYLYCYVDGIRCSWVNNYSLFLLQFIMVKGSGGIQFGM